MIRMLKFLLTGDWHLHEWEDVGSIRQIFKDEHSKLPHRFEQVQRCKICGQRRVVK